MNVITPPQWLEVTDAFIDIQSGATQLVDLLCQSGEHPDILLKKTRLFKKDFLQMNRRITAQQLAQLYFNATLSQGHDALAFKLGQRILPTALGILSNGLIHAPDLNSAIDYLINSTSFWSPLLTIDARHHDKQLHLTFLDKFGLLDDQLLKQFVIIYSLSAMISILTWLTGKGSLRHWIFDIEPCCQKTAVELCAWLPANVHLNQPFFAIAIPQDLLPTSFNQASATLFHLDNKRLIELRLSQHSLIDILRTKMITNIQIIPPLNQIATELQLSSATLKRKLKKHKTTYQSIVDEVRAREVSFLQHKAQLSDNDIAKKLNFYDVSNLRRAKQRWVIS